MRRGAAVVLMGAVLLMSCSDDAPPQAIESNADGTADASATSDATTSDATTADATTADATTADATTSDSTTSDDSTGSGAGAASSTTSTTVRPTSEAPTSEAPTTVSATTVSDTLTVAGLVLRADGIGPLAFGASAETVLSTLSPLLGAPALDIASDYPIATPDLTYQSVDGEVSFVQPHGRVVCYPNGLCVQFGGSTGEALSFTGWYYAGPSGTPLVTADGLGVGSRWADFLGVVSVSEGGCYSVGWGEAAGVELWLQSTGDPFAAPDDAGNWVSYTPDPADVAVFRMEAGAIEVYLFEDC